MSLDFQLPTLNGVIFLRKAEFGMRKAYVFPIPHSAFGMVLSILKGIFQPFSTSVKKEDTLGASGEKIAVKFLKKNGYKILQRNYDTKFGEIDVIGYDHGTVSFIEVKTRLSESFGPPELAVTQTKKNHIIKTAQKYITENKLEGICCRFDVVSVRLSNDGKSQEVSLLKNAFSL